MLNVAVVLKLRQLFNRELTVAGAFFQNRVRIT